VVVAETFARAFYRNAVNNGLLPVAAPTAGCLEGDRIVIEHEAGHVTMLNTRTGVRVSGAPLPPPMAAILAAGGLVPYVKQHGRLPV
jgi:3-isopropylmalate/(R)-2-methylmalate dehydratase small subunit